MLGLSFHFCQLPQIRSERHVLQQLLQLHTMLKPLHESTIILLGFSSLIFAAVQSSTEDRLCLKMAGLNMHKNTSWGITFIAMSWRAGRWQSRHSLPGGPSVLDPMPPQFQIQSTVGDTQTYLLENSVYSFWYLIQVAKQPTQANAMTR
jgi:hypothetical protein